MLRRTFRKFGGPMAAAVSLSVPARFTSPGDNPRHGAQPHHAHHIASNFARCEGVCAPCGRTSTLPRFDGSRMSDSFLRVCDFLIDEAVEDLRTNYEMLPAELAWVRDMLNYNVKGGKMARGLMVIASGKELVERNGKPATSEQLCKLAVLGCCVEWLQGWLLVADDIMDSSETRRGQKCWYKVPHVQMIAINDAFMLEMLVYRTLKKHFKDDCHTQLVQLFHETTLQTECGQLMDTRCEHLNLSELTLDRWTLIAKYKTSFYSFYLPIALGMVFAGISDQAAHDVARETLVKMGIYFQAQDDFLDWAAPPEVLGKIGTDIQDKKCSWLFVHAYHQLASKEQKQIFDKHYGSCKVGSKEEQQIKDVYWKLGMKRLYEEYEQRMYAEISAMKPTVESAGLPWSIFEAYLKKIYKRSK